jgi:protein TonB
MLKRAMFLSVLLHLVISLSLFHLEIVSRPASPSFEPKALKVVLGEREKYGAHTPDDRKMSIADGKSAASIRIPNVGPRLATDHFEFRHFSRLTVETSKFETAEPKLPFEQKGTDQQPLAMEDVGLYRLAVARSMRQFKAYPPVARENGWEGVVQISVVMPIGSRYPIVSLGGSSGHDILDHQALEMAKQAVDLAVLPESMLGRSWSISLPIEYRLTD